MVQNNAGSVSAELGCSQTELKIVGYSSKLIYITSWIKVKTRN